MKCARPWCDPPGEIEVGYCNRCGSPPAEVAAPVRDAVPASAATVAPRNVGESSPRTGTPRSGTTRAAATGTQVRAASRVELPPPDIKDIADVLLEDPSIPENKRYCGVGFHLADKDQRRHIRYLCERGSGSPKI